MKDIIDAFPFIWDNASLLWEKALDQLAISAVAMAVALAIAIPLGVWLGHIHRGAWIAINLGNIGRALPSLAKADPEPALWISPTDAATRGVEDGMAIRIVNERGAMQARAKVTERIPAGSVWMRDGWAGLNELTSGGPAIPDAAVDAFTKLGFSGGQATFDARVDVERAGS